MEFNFSHLPGSLTEPAFLARVSRDGRIRLADANSAWFNLMGAKAEETIGVCLEGLPGEAAARQFASQLQHHLRKNPCNLLWDGIESRIGERQLRTWLMPICDERGLLRQMFGLVRDNQADLPKASTETGLNLRGAINDCNRALMRAKDEQSLLKDICRIICHEAGYRMAWVGFSDAGDHRTIRPTAWAAEMSSGLSEAVTALADQNSGDGSSGMALRSGKCHKIQDLAKASPRASWHAYAISYNLGSSIALPLKDDRGDAFGVLNIYATQTNAFSPDVCAMLEELAGNLALGITAQRARVSCGHTEAERIWNLHFFESMDKINRAIQRSANLEQMMGEALDAILDIFNCDRAYLLQPCDPEAATWRVPMERTRADYPGVLSLGLEMEMSPEVSRTLRILLAADGPVQFGPGRPHSLPEDIAERFELKSFMATVLYPKIGKPWQFGIHQCTAVRRWSAEEERLLNEIGLRLSDGLTSMLILRNLLDSKRKLKEAERKFHTLVDHLPYCIVRFDRDGRVLYVNQATISTFGFTSDLVIGKTIAAIGDGSETENALLGGMIKRVFDGGVANSLETRWFTHNGLRLFDVIHIPERDEDGQVVSVLGIGHDITDRKLAEEALRKSEERYRCIVDAANEGIWMVDASDQTSFVNARMAEMLGYSVDEIIGRPMLDFMFEKDRPMQLDWSKALHQGAADSTERRLRCQGGRELWTLASAAPLMNGKRNFTGAITMFTDITERKQQQEQLLYQAHYDPLTGLPNRFLAMDRLEQNIKVATRNNASTALLFLDLDDFKKVNDTLGHEVGDQVLMLAANRLKQAVRNSDTVARLGGDEFIVLIPDVTDGKAVRAVAEKIVQAFQEVIQVMGRQVMLTASLGISIYPDNGREPLLLLRNADTAMYHSKAKGRNGYHYFTESMNQNVARRLQLEEQLRMALKRNEFYLVYQPIVNVTSGQVVAAEALLRWRNRVLGEVPTDEFIDIAEQTGLIIEIGEWVLKSALQQLHNWERQTGNGFRLALNVSPSQFLHASFVDELEHTLERVGVEGERVELEITEGILLSGEVGAAEVIGKLRALGVTISMDDFGTGYSSLSYLRRYHFDTLKIDRIFIRDVIDDPNDREMILATLRMARSLSVKVVAEGVETGEQLDFLRRESCDCAQGFYLSKPVQAQGFGQILDRQAALSCSV